MKSDSPKSGWLNPDDILPGDHIYVKRKGRFYSHHGIYVGEENVIHFTGSVREKVDPVVQKTELSGFLKGGVLRRRDYHERLPASETINLACKQLSNGRYSMIWNNCEHFATYCATGKKKSRQTKRAVSGMGALAAGAAVFVLSKVVSLKGKQGDS